MRLEEEKHHENDGDEDEQSRVFKWRTRALLERIKRKEKKESGRHCVGPPSPPKLFVFNRQLEFSARFF